MILLAILVIWLVLVAFFVALCRGAAFGDRGRDRPAESMAVRRTVSSGLVVWEEPCDVDVELRDLRLRGRGAQRRAGQYAAGS